MEVKQVANIKSAKKRIKTSEVRAMRNKSIKSRVKSTIKKVEVAIESNDKATATSQLQVAIKEISSAMNKGIFHKNTAARKISRLTKAVNSME